MQTLTVEEPMQDAEDAALLHLRDVVDRAAQLLPAQGPITVFIAQNKLAAFESLPYDEAVKKATRVYGCQPYLTEERYRDLLAHGRIRFAELQAVIEEDLGPYARDRILDSCSRAELRLAMLQYPLRQGSTDELVWFIAETDALKQVRSEVSLVVRERMIAETRRWVMRDLRPGAEAHPGKGKNGNGSPRPRRAREANDANHRQPIPACLVTLFDKFHPTLEQWTDANWEEFTVSALWRMSCDAVHLVPPSTPAPPGPIRHRDLLLEETGDDIDLKVNEFLIRFCAAFLDQGLAPWKLPYREQGFYRSFGELYRQGGGPPDRWLHGLDAELQRLDRRRVGPLESIQESLVDLGVPQEEWQDFIAATLLALRGWGGMVQHIESRGDRVACPVPEGTVESLLAVRLILERFALRHQAYESLGYRGPLSQLRHELRQRLGAPRHASTEQRAFLVFQVVQLLGLSPDMLHRLDAGEWEALLYEMDAFSGLERRRVFHLAYERRFRTQALDAIAVQAAQPQPPSAQPRFQAVFCIDDREESLRRHLEEIAADAATFGAAGFFNIPMYYRGVADAHYVPLCPIVITPGHWVAEDVVEQLNEAHRRQAEARKVIGKASHQLHVGSRGILLGAVLTALGVFASIPLVARILFPRLTAHIRRTARKFVEMPLATKLQLERKEAVPGPENGRVGFQVDEMADMGERLLRDLGLTSGFARLVLLVGHCSNSLNNPHNSAYNCGACGGGAGGPNARAMAQILNDPRVRARLAQRGLLLPEGTWFVGGMHDTCSDALTFFDTDRIPTTHLQEWQDVQRDLTEATKRNAHERCRRFMSAPLTLTFDEAKQHVEARAEDLAQTRPECGHATNALCIVGRRHWTRGLFLDRRAFLTSYDPTQDDADSSILTGILRAVFPVCSGINLEYNFSYVDNTGLGCGTKLPHNLTALIGVMDGAASDLRIGLPAQMVEIHEPLRLLIIIETTPDVMLRIMDRQPMIGMLCRNTWIQLALQDPETGAIACFSGGAFHPYQPQSTVLPKADTSVDWYRGWRDHLEFAQIGAD